MATVAYLCYVTFHANHSHPLLFIFILPSYFIGFHSTLAVEQFLLHLLYFFIFVSLPLLLAYTYPSFIFTFHLLCSLLCRFISNSSHNLCPVVNS